VDGNTSTSFVERTGCLPLGTAKPKSLVVIKRGSKKNANNIRAEKKKLSSYQLISLDAHSLPSKAKCKSEDRRSCNSSELQVLG
jgi:hypothetical protein